MRRTRWVLAGSIVLLAAAAALAVLFITRDSDEDAPSEATATELPAPATAPPGAPPRPSAPAEQARAEGAIAARWTSDDILEALRNPVRGSVRQRPSSAPGANTPAEGSGVERTGGAETTPGASAPRAATAACNQPPVQEAHPARPFTRTCYRGNYDTPAARWVGKIIHDFPCNPGPDWCPESGYYPSSCSASVAGTGNGETPGNQSVILTAGHCVILPVRGHDNANGREWKPIKNMFFVRALTLRSWLRLKPARRTTAWLKQRAWYPLTFSGTSIPIGWVPNAWTQNGNDSYAFDFAAIVMSRRKFGGRPMAIAQRLGGLPVTMGGRGFNRTMRVLGYPADEPFDYYRPRLFECNGPSALGDPKYPGRANAELSVGCDMTGGASGGPWLADTDSDGVREVVSVTSNGWPEIKFGPNLNARDHWPHFDAARKYS